MTTELYHFPVGNDLSDSKDHMVIRCIRGLQQNIQVSLIYSTPFFGLKHTKRHYKLREGPTSEIVQVSTASQPREGSGMRTHVETMGSTD